MDRGQLAVEEVAGASAPPLGHEDVSVRVNIQVSAAKVEVKHASPIDAAQDEEEDNNYDGNYRVWSAETSDTETQEPDQRRRESDEQCLKEKDGSTPLADVAEDLGHSDEDVWSVEGSDEEGHGADVPKCASSRAKEHNPSLNTTQSVAAVTTATQQCNAEVPGARNAYLLSDCRACKSVLVQCYRVDELD